MKIFGINADFTLVDYGFIGYIYMFNRVLNRDNVARLLVVNYINHYRETG